MTQRPSPGVIDPANVFAKLSEMICRGVDAARLHAAICVAATVVVPGCDHASLQLRRNGRYALLGASGPIARHVEDLALRAGEGPCLDVVAAGGPRIEPNLRAPARWPTFATMVVAETPVRGAMGFRLTMDDGKIAALDLYSNSPNLFNAQIARQAGVLVSFAAVSINAMAHGHAAATLRRGLHTNRKIGKAVGMLMMAHHLSEDEAFDMLRRHSQQLNIKLADLAGTVVQQRGQLPTSRDPR